MLVSFFYISIFIWIFYNFIFKSIVNLYKNSSTPKGYIKIKPQEEYYQKILKRVKNITRDGYTRKKVPENLDAIVIGSGIGGLTCAALLSKVGKKVLVLEQHYIAGGCTHTFEDKGYEFDTGVHYIGNIEKRKVILDLIADEKIEWDKMGNKENGYCYDEINIEGKMYYLRAGEKAFLEEVKKHFPEEVDNVKVYLKDVKKVSSGFSLLKLLNINGYLI